MKAQLDRLNKNVAAATRAMMLNHFRLINDSWDQATRLNAYATAEW